MEARAPLCAGALAPAAIHHPPLHTRGPHLMHCSLALPCHLMLWCHSSGVRASWLHCWHRRAFGGEKSLVNLSCLALLISMDVDLFCEPVQGYLSPIFVNSG